MLILIKMYQSPLRGTFKYEKGFRKNSNGLVNKICNKCEKDGPMTEYVFSSIK